MSSDEPLRTWEMKTLAFGVASSPYLALRCIKELLQQQGHAYPRTAEVVGESLYMDDLVVSLPTVKEAEILFYESVELFRKGRFELTKWISNSKEVLDRIPTDSKSKRTTAVNFEGRIHILGLTWDPREDRILINFPAPASECTKRSILSSVARCFDPLGLTAPLTLYLKVLVKELWSSKLDWDEPAPKDVQRRWNRIQAEWPSLRRLEIKRSFGADRNTAINLFGFADASGNGYGGVIYLQKLNGDSELQLACGKSRVSPIKVMSVLRLELSAALLLVKLMVYVAKVLGEKIQVSEIFLFSDSSTVLQWLNGGGSNDTFVRNRVTRIKEMLPEAKWRHIAGKDNPADGLSRGLSPVQLVDYRLWFEGPRWVTLPEEEWPCLKFDPGPGMATALIAVRKTEASEDEHPLLGLIERKSSWNEIVRVTVWVLRGLRILPRQSRMALSDLETAERVLVRLVQKKHFAEDWERLQKGRECSSRLRKLQPFLHQGVLRVGG